MTVLFKLKVEDRPQLYYAKFKYKLVIKETNLSFANYATSMADFGKATEKAKIQRFWKQPIPNTGNEDVIEAIIDYRLKYESDDRVSLRKEGDSLTIYTNEIFIINDAYSFAPAAKLVEANAMPTGVMIFKREPPAKFRVYLSGGQVSSDFRDEMLSHLAKTPDMKPSKSFDRWLHYTYRYAHVWTYSSHYLDFNQDSDLMMLYLLFTGAFGKNYKLEKKS